MSGPGPLALLQGGPALLDAADGDASASAWTEGSRMAGNGRFDGEHRVERSMARAVLVGMAVGIPLGALVWVGLVALALAGTNWSLGPALAMAVGVGALAGMFFGGWAGVVAWAHTLDDVDGRVARHVPA